MKRRPENVEENFSCPLCGIRLRCRRADSSVFTVNILPRHNKEIFYCALFLCWATNHLVTYRLGSIRGTVVGNFRIFTALCRRPISSISHFLEF